MSATLLTGCDRRIVVGIAELAVSNTEHITLTTYSLGSCLGIAVYDPAIRAGGLLHVMLPDSKIDPAKASQQPGMFVDTGVPALFRAAYRLGAEKRRLVITVAGGAEIMDGTGQFHLGRRNFEALQRLLDEHDLRIHAEEIGGLANRSMQLHLGTGEVRLKTSGMPRDVSLCRNSMTT